MNIESIEQERLLAPLDGYTPHMGLLVASLDYCRAKTMFNVKHLTGEQLDHHFDERANSIGTLLLHMAAVEVAMQELTFYRRDGLAEPEILGKWANPLSMGEWARRDVRGYPVEYYFEAMNEVRAKTLQQFQTYNDDWLWQTLQWKRGILTNHYWLWYHVFEDEMAHRGEINWLMSRLP